MSQNKLTLLAARHFGGAMAIQSRSKIRLWGLVLFLSARDFPQGRVKFIKTIWKK